jgi:hypothetical protein
MIVRLNFVVVGGVDESEGQHSLLLQIRFVYPSERTDNDSKASEIPWFKSRVFARRTFSVVVVTCCIQLAFDKQIWTIAAYQRLPIFSRDHDSVGPSEEHHPTGQSPDSGFCWPRHLRN